MSCWMTIQDYGLRAVGIGERLLPREDFTLCQQFTLIGSGMIWNIYFGVFALISGFFFANALAMAKSRAQPAGCANPRNGSSSCSAARRLFVQFFFGYFLFLSAQTGVPDLHPLHRRLAGGAGGAVSQHSSAYSAEIFYGALRSIPKGDVEAADAYGFSGWPRFQARSSGPPCCGSPGRPIPTRRSFCFTPRRWCFSRAFRRGSKSGDALYYANYFADKTFNPFVPYPILCVLFYPV